MKNEELRQPHQITDKSVKYFYSKPTKTSILNEE